MVQVAGSSKVSGTCQKRSKTVLFLQFKGDAMRRVYVAGPYSADNVLDVLKNIGRGEHYCAELFMDGFAPFCPWHDKSYVTDNFEREFTVKQFYDFSMAWLEVSDAVYLLKGWEKSKGTLLEIKRAKELNIPVFANYHDLLKWRDSETD